MSVNRRKFLLFVGSTGLLLLGNCNPIINPQKSKTMSIPENKIYDLLKSNKKITLRWDCGGDEALIYSFIDGKEIDFEDPLSSELDMLILNAIELPSVGEFSMDGTGEIILEDDKVYLVCESIFRGYEDYTQEGESLGWKETNEVDETCSGKIELFQADEFDY